MVLRIKEGETRSLEAQTIGKLGGQKTARLHGREHFVRISKLGKLSRQRNKLEKETRPDFKLTEDTPTNGLASTSLKSESEGKNDEVI